MKNKDIFFALGGIDEKWLAEAETVKKQSGLKHIFTAAVAVAACLILTGTGVFMYRSGVFTKPEPSSSALTVSTGERTENKEEITYGNEPSSGDSLGGYIVSHPVSVPENTKITVTGERISDEEAKKYLAENKISVSEALSASGVDAGNISFSEKGYCHVAYSDEDEKTLSVNEGCRDYLVYNGEKLVAIITLIKENGVVTGTPMFGAKWFDGYNRFLQKNKGGELIYVYLGMVELVIAPDNTVYAPVLSPHGADAAKLIENIENAYEIFYHKSAVYVP